jgi:hypothetical protein
MQRGCRVWRLAYATLSGMSKYQKGSYGMVPQKKKGGSEPPFFLFRSLRTLTIDRC